MVLTTIAQAASPFSVYEIAARLTHPISLAAFALAIILGILTLKRKIPTGVWILIGLLVLGPIGISSYLELNKARINEQAVYKVRVIVTTPEGTPTEDAKVWSSIGGEAKKVAGGWEFSIPKATKPREGKLQVYASQPNRFLVGQQTVELGDDTNVSITVSLQPEKTAQVRGKVIDRRNKGLAGARVSVVGHEGETFVTGTDGGFVLSAHAAKDQQVLLHVEKPGYAVAQQWHPAGDFPAVIVLERK